tara:strand:- start:2496 stop:3224 length:729 start_codon:yes stop_codon:yes gene_type:complete
VIQKRFLVILFFIFVIGCSENKVVSLDYFIEENDVFESGESLMNLSFGLHLLEESNLNQNTLLVSVHGSASRGYEWIYPLQTLNNEKNLVSFFRWNDNACPGPSIISLLEFIKDKLNQNPYLNRVELIGHSYGGLLVTDFLKSWDIEVPLKIHSIAAPLKGLGASSSLCNYQPPVRVEEGTSLHQWRTVQELDGAFKDLDYDPQEVEIRDSLVTRLPRTYNGNKLGHNWSISWVADEINKNP